jgi:ubiquinone/menaquinone biosynthesis C-methylase UbiE
LEVKRYLKLRSQKKMWESLAEFDPMWAILTTEGKKGRKWNPEEFFQHGKSEVSALMADLDSLGVRLNRKSIMDFGCGIGRLTQAFSECFEHCLGIDISSEMIEKARELNRFPDRCQYLVNETADLAQLANNSFHLVYSSMVLQHVAPTVSSQYIKEFIRVAKPGGVIVFQIPYYIHWRRRIQWRRRLFVILQAFGFKGTSLLEKLRLNPMRMSYIPQQKIEQILKSCSASIVNVKRWSDRQIGSCRYVVRKDKPYAARNT